MFLSRALIGLLVFACVPAHAMSIKAPDIAENGAVVPVEIKLDSPLTAGQYLELRANGQLATQVRVLEGKLTAFSTRVKFSQTGNVSARVIANGKEIDSASREVQITIGASVDGPPTSVTNHRIRAQSGDLKLLLHSANGFAGTLVLQDTGFRAEVGGSALLSNNPFIGVKGDFSDRIGVSFGGGQVFSNPVPVSAPVAVAAPAPAPVAVPTPVKRSTPSRPKPAKNIVKRDVPKPTDGSCAKVMIINGKKICDE